MASPRTKNILAVLFLMCAICGVLIIWSPRTTTDLHTDTVVYSEQYEEDAVYYTIPLSQELEKETDQSTKVTRKDNEKDNLHIVDVAAHKTKAKDTTTTIKTAATTTESVGTTSTVSSTSSSTTSTSPSTGMSNNLEKVVDASQGDAKAVAAASHQEMATDAVGNLTEFRMDFEESDDLEAVLDARRHRVYELCRQYSTLIEDSLASSPRVYGQHKKKNHNIFTNHDDRLTYCSVAKAGSTFWKSVFIFLTTGEVINGLSIPHYLDSKSMRSLNMWQRAKDYGRYTSFVAVRNPWKRLVSLYQQKIESFLPALIANRFTSARGMPQYKYMLTVCRKDLGEMVTFADMLDCVLKRDILRKPNRHWEAAYEYCDICNQDYSYIIRTENMMQEGAFVMQKAGLSQPATILNTVRTNTIRDVEKHKPRHYSEYYRDIDPEVIARLKDIYKWEIKLFNYPDTPFTK